jgi:hypothetical protein
MKSTPAGCTNKRYSTSRFRTIGTTKFLLISRAMTAERFTHCGVGEEVVCIDTANGLATTAELLQERPHHRVLQGDTAAVLLVGDCRPCKPLERFPRFLVVPSDTIPHKLCSRGPPLTRDSISATEPRRGRKGLSSAWEACLCRLHVSSGSRGRAISPSLFFCLPALQQFGLGFFPQEAHHAHFPSSQVAQHHSPSLICAPCWDRAPPPSCSLGETSLAQVYPRLVFTSMFVARAPSQARTRLEGGGR